MRSSFRAIAALSTAVVLAACSGGGTATTGPTTGGPAATSVASICTEPASTEATDISASVAGNKWSQPVAAKVGEVITWANDDSVPHRVALDDGSCSMSKNIAGAGKGSLVFSVAGTYPFHCSVHPSMKGTITIS